MRVQPKTAIVAGLVILAIALVAVFGSQWGIPPEVTRGALAFLGSIGTLTLGAMRSILREKLEDPCDE